MKAKKTAAQARASHLAMQARRDALARLREGETVSLSLVGGVRVSVRPLAEDESPAGQDVLVLLNQRLRACFCTDKDTGARFRVTGRYIGRQDVLGVVAVYGV